MVSVTLPKYNIKYFYKILFFIFQLKKYETIYRHGTYLQYSLCIYY